MKKTQRLIICALTTLILAFGMSLVTHADGNGVMVDYSKMVTILDNHFDVIIRFDKVLKKNSIIEKVSSSNQKVVSEKTAPANNIYAAGIVGSAPAAHFMVKGKGKATLTINTKTGNKKTVYKMIINVVSFKDPFKSVRYGNKNVKRKKGYLYTDVTGKRAALKIKMKSGWVVESILQPNNGGFGAGAKNLYKKNKPTYLTVEDREYIYQYQITVYNKKKNQRMVFWLQSESTK